MSEVAWRELVEPGGPWAWEGSLLVHEEADRGRPAAELSGLHAWVLRRYAHHNDSPAVTRALSRMLEELGPEDWGLNFGAGATSIHPRLLNLDVQERESLDILARGLDLPFKDGCLKAVVSQEVLEHLADPARVVAEVFRVLEPGGLFYCQVPFMIGYHPGPNDFWRFTREGVQELFSRQAWEVEQLDLTLGHGSGFYRIAVEYVAVTASAISPALYKAAKGAAALALQPLKLTDRLTPRVSQPDRIPGGYFCVARKPSR